MIKLRTIFLSLVVLCMAACSTAVDVDATSPESQTIKHYLSGTGSDDTVEWDFFCSSGMKSGSWQKIPVPSCWEQQGFGHYNYGHDAFEDRVNEYGLYKYNFSLPKEWYGRAVRIVFEAVMTDAEVKINGQSVGEKHQGAFYEFKYDVEHLLKFGADNLLEVKVDKASSNMSINHAERKADFWLFGGVIRPVYLEVMPNNHIERLAIDAAASGAIKADIFTDSKSAEGVAVELQDLYGNKVQTLKGVKSEKLNDRFSFEAQAQGVKLWNPEQPNLYQLQISITDGAGKALHTLTQRIGFRTVEILDADGVYVNGSKVKFKGVNRHTFHPETGRTTNRSVSLEHIEMIKDMNMNSVRMSHYPPEVHFLDLCDSLGLFVIDEVCTWHTPKLDTEVGRKIVRETVTRDVNHPSIIFWANGNETGWNTELDGDYSIYDIQKRTVIHPWNVFGKVNNLHYPLYTGAVNDSRAQDKILFHTEFLHGMYDGGHGTGLEDFWNLHWNNPLGAGGFLWCFADEGVVRTDKDGILDTNGNMAADGIVGPYLEKEASYFTIKEIWSPIYIEDRYVREDFNGQFRVENRYHFTDLDECRMEAKWMKYGDADASAAGKVLSSSKVKLPHLHPLEKGVFEVDKPKNWRTADALHLTAYDPHGKEIFTWSYQVKLPAELNAELIKHKSGGAVKSTTSGDDLTVKAGKMEFVFDRTNAKIKSVKRGGKLIPFSGGPLILDQKKIVKDKVDHILTDEVDGKTEFTFVFEKALYRQEWVTETFMLSDTVKWTVHTDGMLDLRVTHKGSKTVRDGYKGLSFSYPEQEVTGMKWLGDGPYRVWRNRMKGTAFQVWENDYNNTVTGYSGFVYPEFKGFFSNIYWAEIKGKDDNGFKVYCHTPHLYIRVFTPDKPEVFPRGNPVFDSFPAGDISFVYNIPGMGTKFQAPNQTGPHGSEINYHGNFDEPLITELTFDFE